MYYDAHNHLQDGWLAPALDQIAGQLATLPLGAAVVNGTHPNDWPDVQALAGRFPWVRPSFGVHPWHCGRLPAGWLELLENHLAADARAGVGEIGLDRWILDGARPDDPRLAGLPRTPLDRQIPVFLAQLALAAIYDRPVTIHCLQAWSALDELLRTDRTPARGFLLHAYGGPAELIPTFVERGAYFSFNGSFLDPRKTRQQGVFQLIPAERLLVETDAPAMPLPPVWRTHKLPPASDGSTVNHPGNLEAAYAGLASLRGIALPDLASQVKANFHRFFDR